MKLSFLPGDLHLFEREDGSFVVVLQGHEVMKSKSRRAAIERFNNLREEMQSRFPMRELTPDEKALILRQAIAESLVQHNSLGGRKKKSSAGSTRTFGG